jgi:iturin family lipopeptide synthetase B
MEILERDFSRIYHALAGGSEIESIPAAVTYKDFALWHHGQLETASAGEVSRAFWKTFLEGELPRLRLPVDPDRGAHREIRSGAGFRFVIPAPVRDALKTLGSQHRLTLFTLLYSLYNIWLARISGQSVIVSGIVNAGRVHPSLRDLVGFFVNSLLCRVRIEEEELFIDFARRVGESVLELFRHQDYPLESVLDERGLKYPDVATSFNMLNMGRDAEAPLENLNPVHLDDLQDVKFDLEPYVAEFTNGIEITVNYRKSLFKPEHIELVMKKFLDIVEYFALNPHHPVKAYKETRKKRSFRRRNE